MLRVRHPGYVRMVLSGEDVLLFSSIHNCASHHMESVPDDCCDGDGDCCDGDGDCCGSDGSDDDGADDGGSDEAVSDDEGSSEAASEDDGDEHHHHRGPALRFGLAWAPALATLFAAGRDGVRVDKLPRPTGEPLAAALDVARGLLVEDIVEFAQ